MTRRIPPQRGHHRFELPGQPYVVSIKKGEVLAGRTANAGISSSAQAAVALSDDLNLTGILLKNRGGGVGRTVVYDHDFVPFIVLRQGAVDCLSDGALGVIGRDYC